MKKVLGIFGLLVVIVAFTAWQNPRFLDAYNLENTLRWTGLFGIISIGVAFVIITGGIDLSIGSIIGLIGAMLPWLLVYHDWPLPAAIAAVLGVALLIGLTHGLLITKLRLQPFVVTLCGLLIYRGLARWITDDATQGFGIGYTGIKQWVKGGLFDNLFGNPLTFEAFGTGFRIELPMAFVYMALLAIAAGVLLNLTVWGRYLFALGNNEEAARFSGIRTDRVVIGAYVICAMLAGLAGILFAVDLNAVQPSSQGNFYELYAIAAAVLGGCSLRGGEGSILGVVIGAAIMRVLYNAINILGISTQLEFAIIGLVILAGVVVDELVKRLALKARGSP